MAMTTPQEPWSAPETMLVPVADGQRIPALTHALDRFAGRWLKLRDQSPEVLDSLRRVATIESAGASTRIEGAQLSDEDVSAVLSGLSLDSFRARDEQEVRGYAELSDLIFESHSHMPVTENTIKQMHGVLLRYSDKDRWHAGEYKISPNHVESTRPGGTKVTVFQTAPPAETRWWMRRLVEEFAAARESGDWHPLVLIADFIVWFLAIHPFQDGNGRLSRALTMLLLLQARYEYVPYASLEGVIEDNKAAYYTALRTAQGRMVRDPSQYTDWVEFFLRAMAAQRQRLEAGVTAALATLDVPPAQRRLLDAIASGGAQTSSALAAHLGISERTARYRLANLVRAGRLQASRRTAGRRYSLPADEATSGSALPVLSARPDVMPTETTREVDDAPAVVLAASSVDPLFQRYAGGLANGRAYATVVVAAAPTSMAGLGDDVLDEFDRLVTTLAPDAEAVHATPEGAWWHIRDTPNSDLVSLWLHPGPVIEVLWGLEGPSAAPLGERTPRTVDTRALVAYWRAALDKAGALMAAIGHSRCAIALGLQTYPAAGGELRDLDTTGAPDLRRTGQLDAPPPWHFEVAVIATSEITEPPLVQAALDGLFRHFSYRHTEAGVAAILATAPAAWSPTAGATTQLG